MARKLTAHDAREVTGYSRDEFRALLSTIAFHKSHEVEARIAHEFSRHDLLVLTVIRKLETTYGMRRAAIAELYKLLRLALSGPKPINRNARLLISVAPPGVKYVEASEEISEGLVVGLQTVFDRVDTYLGTYGEAGGGQRDLRLSPTVIRHRTRNAGGQK